MNLYSAIETTTNTHTGSAPASFGAFDVVHMFTSLSAEKSNRADWQDDMRNHFVVHAIFQRNNNSKAKSHLCKKGNLVTSFSICWIRFPADSPPSRRVVPFAWITLCKIHRSHFSHIFWYDYSNFHFWKNGWSENSKLCVIVMHSVLGQDTCDRQQLVKVGM